MIRVGSDLQERDFIAIADVEAGCLEYSVHRIRDHRAAVLGRTDQMIKQRRNIVCLVNVLAHATHHTKRQPK